MATKVESNEQIKSWRFFLPLIIQTAIIFAVPAQAFFTYITGTTVILETQPIDPYDLLRGYSQTLSYQISNTSNLSNLEGWEDLWLEVNSGKKVDRKNQDNYLGQRTKLYVILEAPTTLENQIPPSPWQPIKVSLNSPQNLPDNQIAIAGIANFTSVEYGLETYFLPEHKRQNMNRKINQIQRDQETSFYVEIKVSQNGKAVPVSLWLGEENYRF